MRFICPLLTVEDIDRSKRFYTEALGRTIKFDFGEDVTFQGDFTIHDRAHFGKLLGGRSIQRGKNDVELYFEHDNVEEMEKRLEEEGVAFVHRTKEQPWRQKVLRFYDPDGYVIEIGESMEYLSFRLWKNGMSDDEIVSAVGIPIDLVRKGIALFK